MSDTSLQATPLEAWHRARGARMVGFGGWSMPLQYTSIVEEHRAVRQKAGLFDISHMGRLDFRGDGSVDWIERLTTNHVARLDEGQIQYSLLLNERGGVIDDILVYRGPSGHSVVCNASNRDRVVRQFLDHAPADAELIDRTTGTAMIALQGPMALDVLRPLCPETSLAPLRYYHCQAARVEGAEAVVSRTGYTGEDGFELVVAADDAEPVWEALMRRGEPLGLLPCGLGARDTLRFEAAMPLYGHELDDSIHPYEAGLGWAVKLGKGPFVGRDALRELKDAPARRVRIGLSLAGKRIPRQGYTVFRDGSPVGVVTSGTFAPTLERSLAMALVSPDAAAIGTHLAVDLRGQLEVASVVPMPFYRRDKHLTTSLKQAEA